MSKKRTPPTSRPAGAGPPYTREDVLAAWWAVLVVDAKHVDGPEIPSALKDKDSELSPDETMAVIFELLEEADRTYPLDSGVLWVDIAKRDITKGRAGR